VLLLVKDENHAKASRKSSEPFEDKLKTTKFMMKMFLCLVLNVDAATTFDVFN
jgi:hypothetical protein